MTGTDANLPPLRAPAKKHGGGCWLVAFASVVIATLLLIIGLLLPPFNLPDRLFALQYTSLDVENPELALGSDFSVRIPGDSSAADIAIRVSTLPWTADETDAGDPSVKLARDNLPAYLAPQSPLYVLEGRGDLPEQLRFSFAQPANVSDANVLSLYGWDGRNWRFVPSEQSQAQKSGSELRGVASFAPGAIAVFQTIAAPPILMISQETTQELDPDVAALATIVSPAGLRPTRQGGLTGRLAPGGDAESDYLYMPVIRNFDDPRATDPAAIDRLISDDIARDAHVSQISSMVASNGFHGIVIDYRELYPEARQYFSRFIDQLSSELREQGLLLGIVVPAHSASAGEADAYDWRALGAAVDIFKLDVSIAPGDHGAGDDQLVTRLLRRAVDRVDRYKILLGLGAQNLREHEGAFARIGFAEALSGLGDVTLDAESVSETGSVEPGTFIRASLNGLSVMPGHDDSFGAGYLDYLTATDGSTTRIWVTDGAALSKRLNQTLPFGLAGVAIDDLLSDDLFPGLLQAVRAYLAQLPPPNTPGGWSLRWSIARQDSLVDEAITRLNEDFVLTLVAPEGNYAINAAVINSEGESISQRAGAALPLFAATPTATPTPTPTPAPSPTPPPAPVVVAPVANEGAVSAPSDNFAAVVPPAGSINIEIGGHVTSAGSQRAIGAMRAAGMTWMKIQARFDWRSPPDMGREIRSAHDNGFKILVGTVGRPNELEGGGQSYVDSYTDWLARIAGQGADAIEVWNEPNLDREWPRGQISGADYARMLAGAWQKIKAANPGTLVISAAPAPTGVSDRPDQVMPDNRWLREMVDGGGLDYLDCVGAHYNEGIVPPSQTRGDPRGDNYYTRYFYGMLNGYISITRRPICFTELGYLTADGYPALSDYFSWADNVTVQQQAAWLAEAAALASRSGQVRLFIVWNVDFTHYGADPQAGYAIVRPDGSCPACDALARAR